jgi:hypothetical protein
MATFVTWAPKRTYLPGLLLYQDWKRSLKPGQQLQGTHSVNVRDQSAEPHSKNYIGSTQDVFANFLCMRMCLCVCVCACACLQLCLCVWCTRLRIHTLYQGCSVRYFGSKGLIKFSKVLEPSNCSKGSMCNFEKRALELLPPPSNLPN